MPNIKSILSVAEAYAQMVTEANTDHSAAANAASEHAKNTPSMATHHAASNAHEKAASALESEVDKIKETDHTGKHDDKVMKMERDIKLHQQQAQRHRFHAHRIASTQKESFELTEKLDPKADAGTWISDFVHSKDPRFAGKSAEERKNQALAAYYSARREAGLKNEDTGEEGDQSNKRPDVDLKPDTDNLAATDAADAQKKQEPQDEIPSWVPGNIEDKKGFAEAAKKAWESDNNTFDFKGRTYKITENVKNEELVGNQKKLDVNGNGKIDGDDLAALRAGKPANEDLEKETDTPGQSAEMPEGEPRGDGDNDEDDKTDMGDDDKDLDEGVRAKKMADMERVNAGAMSMNAYKTKWANIKSKPANKEDKMSAAKVHGVKESADNPTDKLTLDVPAMIRSLEKAREDFKSDEDVHNFVQGLLAKKDSTIDTNALPKDTVKEGAPGDAKAGPMVIDPLTQATKDDHDDETKVEDAPYTNKADGSENVVPADKPSPNPTPMNKLSGEQITRSVAEAYAKIVAEAAGEIKGAKSAEKHFSKLPDSIKSHELTKKAQELSHAAHQATKDVASEVDNRGAAHDNASDVHADASNAHFDAAQAHSDPAAKEYHNKMSDYHSDRSEYHMDKSEY